jgi:hypothetical protein
MWFNFFSEAAQINCVLLPCSENLAILDPALKFDFCLPPCKKFLPTLYLSFFQNHTTPHLTLTGTLPTPLGVGGKNNMPLCHPHTPLQPLSQPWIFSVPPPTPTHPHPPSHPRRTGDAWRSRVTMEFCIFFLMSKNHLVHCIGWCKSPFIS